MANFAELPELLGRKNNKPSELRAAQPWPPMRFAVRGSRRAPQRSGTAREVKQIEFQPDEPDQC